MIARLRALITVLRPWQAAAVGAVFFVSFFAALGLAILFHRFNERKAA